MVCSGCGQAGHNIRTCSGGGGGGGGGGGYGGYGGGGGYGGYEPQPRQYACGVCGQLGHNSRTCPMAARRRQQQQQEQQRQEQQRQQQQQARAARERQQRDAQEREARKCGHCRQPGHNARTCPSKAREEQQQQQQARAARERQQRDAQERKCGHCRQPGHNVRTCPSKAREEQQQQQQHQARAARERKQQQQGDLGRGEREARKCGHCRQPGHNVRTCPQKEREEMDLAKALSLSETPDKHKIVAASRGKAKAKAKVVKELFASDDGGGVGGGGGSSAAPAKWVRKDYDAGHLAWVKAYKKRTAGLRSETHAHKMQCAHKIDAHLFEKFQVDPKSLAHNENYRMVRRDTNLSIHQTIMNRLEFQYDANDRTPLAAYKTQKGLKVTTQMIADRVSIMIETAKIAGENGKRPIDNAGFRQFLNVAADCADLDRRVFGKDVLKLIAADHQHSHA